MADSRKAIHTFLTPDSHEAWHEFAAEHGVSVSGLIEAIALDWADRRDGRGVRPGRGRRPLPPGPPHRRQPPPPLQALTGSPGAVGGR